jgi:hypothetical protein
MDTNELDALLARMPLPAGYSLGRLEREGIGDLVVALAEWYPGIHVGAASCFLRRDFYESSVRCAGEAHGDVHVVVLRYGDELAGMFAWDIDADTGTVYARLGAAAPHHRGAGLSKMALHVTEAAGRMVGAGLIYGKATLKGPFAQRAYERAGWQLIGIEPGYDREIVESGAVKRVFEAVYAKVLAREAVTLLPRLGDLTPNTVALYRHLFCQELQPEGA